MAELTVESSNSDGFIHISGAAYAPIHIAANGDAVYDTQTYINIRNYLSGGLFQIDRAFLFFDTSLLPPGAEILSAILHLFWESGNEDDPAHSDLHVVEGVQNDPLVVEDYGTHLAKTTSGGYIPYDASLFYEAVEITLNATGIGWINKGGTTLLCLRLSGDKDNLVPTGKNWIRITAADTGIAARRPTLVVTYRAAGDDPACSLTIRAEAVAGVGCTIHVDDIVLVKNVP